MQLLFSVKAKSDTEYVRGINFADASFWRLKCLVAKIGEACSGARSLDYQSFGSNV